MKNDNLSALFSNSGGGEMCKVTITLPAEINDFAVRFARAVRIPKTRWLELLIENAITEYTDITGGMDNGEKDGSTPYQNMVPSRGMGAHQIDGGING
jgi:hypothetical protein